MHVRIIYLKSYYSNRTLSLRTEISQPYMLMVKQLCAMVEIP